MPNARSCGANVCQIAAGGGGSSSAGLILPTPPQLPTPSRTLLPAPALTKLEETKKARLIQSCLFLLKWCQSVEIALSQMFQIALQEQAMKQAKNAKMQ